MRARDNPFATHRLDAIPYQPQGETWEGSLGRLETMGWRGAVVGPEGSGKTALLHDLAPRLEALGFTVRSFRLEGRDEALPKGALAKLAREASPRLFILLDGTEQLGARPLRHFLHAASSSGGFVMARHGEAILPTWVTCKTTPRLLCGLAKDLLGGDVDGIEALCGELFEAHRGNVRQALLALYDRWAAER